MRTLSFSRILPALILTLLLGACGGTPASQPVQLTYAYPDDPSTKATVAAQIKAYTTANPQIQIKELPLPAQDYMQQLSTQLDTQAPDLFVSYDIQVPALIKRNSLLDLNPLLASNPQLKTGDFQPMALETWARGSALYGLPTDVLPHVMFYNQDLFDANGITHPTPGWTWDNWVETAKKLTVSSGQQVTQFGTALGPWAAMVWGNGGELISPDMKRTLLDTPEAVAGVQFAADMVNVHKVAPLPYSANGPEPVKLFIEQQVAMLPASSDTASKLIAAQLPFKWGIAPLPSGVTPASPLSISGVGVSAKTTNQQAAAAFAAWIAGPDGNAVRAGTLPFAAPALRTAPARPTDVSGADAIMAALQHGRTLPPVDSWPEIASIVNEALIPVFEGRQPAAAAYRTIAPNINALLAAG